MEQEDKIVKGETASAETTSGTGVKRDREDNAEVEQSLNKRQSVESTPTASDASRSVPDNTADDNKDTDRNTCALCMEGDSDKKTIIAHSCPRCKEDAWVICDICNESRLSRACPMCNGDYAPLLLHAMPGDAEFLDIIKHRPMDEQAHCMKALQFAKIRLISVSNVMVYNPVDKALSFSLPVDASLPPKQIRYMLVTLPLAAITAETVHAGSTGSNPGDMESIAASLKDEGLFRFSNRIWDHLENRVENDGGAEQSSNYTGDIRSAMAFIMSALSKKAFCASPGGASAAGMCSVLYSCMTPGELQKLGDPPRPNETETAPADASSNGRESA